MCVIPCTPKNYFTCDVGYMWCITFTCCFSTWWTNQRKPFPWHHPSTNLHVQQKQIMKRNSYLSFCNCEIIGMDLPSQLQHLYSFVSEASCFSSILFFFNKHWWIFHTDTSSGMMQHHLNEQIYIAEAFSTSPKFMNSFKFEPLLNTTFTHFIIISVVEELKHF